MPERWRSLAAADRSGGPTANCGLAVLRLCSVSAVPARNEARGGEAARFGGVVVRRGRGVGGRNGTWSERALASSRTVAEAIFILISQIHKESSTKAVNYTAAKKLRAPTKSHTMSTCYTESDVPRPTCFFTSKVDFNQS